MTGTLYGIGVGPGDPELLTIKAARLITAADVVAYHAAGHGRSIARTSAAPYLRAGQIEEPLVYPVTTGSTDHPGGYRGALADFYAAASARLAAHLDAGRDVALLAEGDPTLFSSCLHMQKRLAARYPCVLVPGVTAIAAAAAAAGTPLVEGDEVLAIVPGTLAGPALAAAVAAADAVALMKVSRNVLGIRTALAAAGRLDEAVYVRRASHPDQAVAPFATVDPDSVPYMSTVVVPGRRASSPPPPHSLAPAPAEPSHPVRNGPGEVVVVGLGPAGEEWLTPQARAELAAAEHIVGYGSYVDRVPVAPGQRRHSSDNRVEAERAEFALDLARRGARVAVVSSGDPGVFAMASAVLETRDQRGYSDVRVRVVPGITAANAVASRVGAPLGHDYCVLSLSDQLKPWEVIRARLDAAARADLVLALYNPASRRRQGHLAEVRDLLLAHRAPATPVIVGRAVGADDESVTVVRLEDLADTPVDMRTLLIVGSSRTVAGKAAVYTPRGY